MRLSLCALALSVCTVTITAQNAPPPQSPVPTPLTAYAGRFLDSSEVRDWQAPIRTLRADVVKVAPEHDRIFIKAGGGVFGAYKLSTFVSRLGSPLTTLNPP